MPSGTKAGDTLLLFFTCELDRAGLRRTRGLDPGADETGTSFVGQVYTKTATAADLGSTVTVTSKDADGANLQVRTT